MKISELVNQPQLTLVEGTYKPEFQAQVVLEDVYTSDLLSDVIANAPEDSVLITLQAHKNTVACASLAGIRVILFAHNPRIPEDLVGAAAQEGVVLLASLLNQFQLSCLLGKLMEIVC